MCDFLSGFLSSLVGVSTGALDTRKIDKNIELLKQQDWFRQIYDDNRYYKLFITNRNIRAYLQNTNRVNKIIRDERAQQKLLILLDTQLKSKA
ncbi:hypothetical protein [Peribacillus kribbensis]|uniref:hypothetical protein n=1 Tax=Peribacillus kribbensis TaxID=356658 RepID=UPI00047C6531|nr:hypothetical protein [Peribacillus kribbensis]